ncbi:MAG TPA: putative zinc-binding metallopeptidase, partial [Rhizomicrobium sp.]
MKIFSCQACGQVLYFENIRCEKCGHVLGYLPDKSTITALEPLADGAWLALGARGRRYRFCKNQEFGVCNWMVPLRSAEEYCIACRHNRTIPDLAVPENNVLWARIEAAKHRLFYTLIGLNLPLANRADDPQHGLAFDFLSEPPQSHGQNVLTGHDNGLITLAVREADDAERERVRTAMGEPYRTLLGHFRHEVGHYFWDVLVRDSGRLDSFRSLFGDESQDYAAALQAHYANGPQA